MKVHEYQAKELLKKAGVAVPEGIVVTDADGGGQGLRRARRRPDRGQGPGPRRRPRQGGGDRSRRRPQPGPRDRQRAEAAARVDGQGRAARQVGRRTPQDAAASLLGKTLVTYQTGAQGSPSPRCWSRSATTSPASSTWAWPIDRGLQCPVLMATTEGGVEIETVAHETPEKIHREPIDVGLGLADFQARKICKALGLCRRSAKKGRDVLQELRQALHRHGRLAGRDQPADRHGQRRRAGPRLQAELRRQRPVPPSRHRRDARRGRGRPGRAAGRAERPELRQPRRRHRLPGQRRRPGDEHDGPDQVPRRRAGQLPRRRRRRQQGPGARGVPHPAVASRASRPCWSTSSAAS